MIEVIRPGTDVTIRAPGSTDAVTGVVTGVMIRAHGPSGYEVSWWNGNSRTLAWFEPFEVTPADHSVRPTAIGFGR